LGSRLASGLVPFSDAIDDLDVVVADPSALPAVGLLPGTLRWAE
jgi:hypothetical protein